MAVAAGLAAAVVAAAQRAIPQPMRGRHHVGMISRSIMLYRHLTPEPFFCTCMAHVARGPFSEEMKPVSLPAFGRKCRCIQQPTRVEADGTALGTHSAFARRVDDWQEAGRRPSPPRPRAPRLPCSCRAWPTRPAFGPPSAPALARGGSARTCLRASSAGGSPPRPRRCWQPTSPTCVCVGCRCRVAGGGWGGGVLGVLVECVRALMPGP